MCHKLIGSCNELQHIHFVYIGICYMWTSIRRLCKTLVWIVSAGLGDSDVSYIGNQNWLKGNSRPRTSIHSFYVWFLLLTVVNHRGDSLPNDLMMIKIDIMLECPKILGTVMEQEQTEGHNFQSSIQVYRYMWNVSWGWDTQLNKVSGDLQSSDYAVYHTVGELR